MITSLKKLNKSNQRRDHVNLEELVRRILRGEDLHTEFKETVENAESLAKSIVCFANTDGGQIIIGVSRSGEIIGVKDLNSLERLIDDVAFSRCEPPVTVVVETVEVEGEDCSGGECSQGGAETLQNPAWILLHKKCQQVQVSL
ncbi:MAG: helix-turn-helix domain-containing protein [Candidatus Methanodesulfokora sp.]